VFIPFVRDASRKEHLNPMARLNLSDHLLEGGFGGRKRSGRHDDEECP